MSKHKEYQKTISQIGNSVNCIKEIKDEDEIINPYKDEFTTTQQRSRDKNITALLQSYVNTYNYKNSSNKWYKGILFGVCVLILISFTVVLIFTVINFGRAIQWMTTESVVQLISVCLTFLTLIVGILKIITKYVFPVNDEEYITRIVELIQNNDLENKKENIRAKVAIAERKDENSEDVIIKEKNSDIP